MAAHIHDTTYQSTSLQHTSLQRTNRCAQAARKQNVCALVNFFEHGIKPQTEPGGLGIELEHTIVHGDLRAVSYSETGGVADILHDLARDYPDVTRDVEGDILGVSRPRENITIEPAAQLELSAGPFTTLADAKCVYDAFEKRLGEALAAVGSGDLQALTVGYHPSARARDLELIPKERYRFMNDYLSKTDTCGPCMMRGSASTQVSIDYFSVSDCLRKLRLASACVPLFSLICDNTPIFEGKPRAHRLVRTYIWNHMDADRSGLIPGILSPDFSLEDYANVILDMPAILVFDNEHATWKADARSFGEIYANTPMSTAEVTHALSMSFTDVRLKTYIEIRPADALPIPYAIAYAGLIKGLFYNAQNLDALDALFEGVCEADVVAAKTTLMAHGYDAEVYGRPAAELCDELVRHAAAGLPADEQPFLDPLAKLVAARRTLAEKGAAS